MTDTRLNILPPWSIYIHQLEALFDPDPQIAFNVNWGENNSVVIATNNPDKAAALVKLLPEEKTWGNVSIKISVDCKTMSNKAFTSAKELFETAFAGNPVFSRVITVEDAWFVAFTYVIFKREVVSILADNLKDPWGAIHTLYQDIAEEIFEDLKNTYQLAFSTEVDDVLAAKQTTLLNFAR